MLFKKLRYFHALAGLSLALAIILPALAEDKFGMPDLGQEEQTCLPTSTANLIIWFGKHGYPKLLLSGDTEDARELHTLHAIMTDTNARYDLGTRTDAITWGIGKFIRDAGYSCDVEYRGIDWSKAQYPHLLQDDDGEKYAKDFKTPAAFTPEWLNDNTDPAKGFILLLAYIKFDRATNSFSDAFPAGHAVTLVSSEPHMIIIHDPAHYRDEPGRKILTPEILTGGNFELPGYTAPVNGLMLLTGTRLETPRHSTAMLTGAVCITMHPGSEGTQIIASAGGGPTIGGKPGTMPASAPSAPSTPASENQGWAMWLFDMFFKK